MCIPRHWSQTHLVLFQLNRLQHYLTDQFQQINSFIQTRWDVLKIASSKILTSYIGCIQL